MRIGVISNSDAFTFFTYTLAAQQLQVYIFFSPNKDSVINQRVAGFIQQTKLPFAEEKDAEKDLYQWLREGNYDVCFMLGYSRLIDLSRLKGCPTRLFNIHFGPLPNFRGPVPVFWQLKKGVDRIGLAIHQLSAKFDDGPVVWTKETNNLPHYNYQLVNQVLSRLCVEGVLFIVRLLALQLQIPVIDTSNMTSAYQKRPSLDDVSINWESMSAIEICNLVRACNSWNKGGMTRFNNREVKLMDAVIVTDNSSIDRIAGTIIEDEGFLHIATSDHKVIRVNMLYHNEVFIPTYQCKHWGFDKAKKFT